MPTELLVLKIDRVSLCLLSNEDDLFWFALVFYVERFPRDEREALA
jgi:hypothetical protein